jgi:hypothetical protein
MDSTDQDHSSRHDLTAVRDRPRKRGALPCGSRVCVRCHKGCGVVMAAYLGGLDEPAEPAEEKPKSLK